MADPTVDSGDPLAGWQPGSGAPVAALAVSPDDPLQAAPKKGVLDTSYHTLPSDTRQGKTATADEGYGLMVPATGPSIDALKAGDVATALAPAPGRVYGDVLPWAADQGTGANGNWSLPNFIRGPLQALAGGPSNAVMIKTGPDGGYALSPEAQSIVPFFAGPLRVGGGPTTTLTADAAANATARARELGQPPPPTLPDLLRQRGPANMPPATPEIPSPPAPFTLTPGPTPVTPSGGLLSPTLTGGPLPGPRVAPQGGGLLGQRPTMTAEEMQAQTQAHFAPVDAQIRQGATIPADAADAVRKPLVDQIPSDPQKGIAVGDTPLTKLGTDYQGYQGQPMSYDAAVALDRRLTAEKQAAAAQKGGADLARQIGDVQDKVRDAMDNIPDPSGGDASALAQAKLGRQSYLQYRKQSQLEDIDYNASLLPEDKQDAYRRSQLTSMLRNDNKMRGWFPDERAALETQLKAGNIGSLTNWGLSTIKPVSQALAGGIGGYIGGPIGAVVAAPVGADIGAGLAARWRRNLSGLDLGPVSQRLTANMPPPPGQ